MKTIHSLISSLVLVAAASMAITAHAQVAGLGRVDLLKEDIVVPGKELVQVRVDFAPGVKAPRHSHPGEEIAYVLEGTLEYQIDGQPPVTLKAGQTLFIPAGAVHSAHNVGSGESKELATYIVEKSKPLVTLAK
ncbi:cupin domain-containing protein [Pseudoduganella albidiflava]|uniref:Cupin 2 domain-containing protein n=1 Tax=Pseudoduganella albidiflava TaxID=321983 RepID=A0A411WSL2_9BURK|nr:cupin domain-containing protein [Pseudoduganella albidiflava]QBH99637.1 cupin domain-containing protein [Pseudoduganella albidiflava]GGY46409.1 cupin 2 domain-containing protein [Pseudoduganella albidiflava]